MSSEESFSGEHLGVVLLADGDFESHDSMSASGVVPPPIERSRNEEMRGNYLFARNGISVGYDQCSRGVIERQTLESSAFPRHYLI